MDKINIAIIGCGAVVRRHHMPVFLSNPFVNISALCDTNTAAAELIRERFKLHCLIMDNIDDVLSLPKIDAVIICTPGPKHFDYALKSLKANKNVLLEKPPVTNVADLESLCKIADGKNLKIGTIFNYRYRKEIEILKEKVDRGLLGKIKKIYATHHAGFVFGDSAWLWDESNSMYLVYEFGIHIFDILVYLLGSHSKIEYFKAFQRPEVSQTTEIQVGISFENEAFAHVTISQDSLRHSTFKTNFEIYGTAMDAYIRYFPPLIRFSSGVEHPAGLLWSEIKSVCSLGYLLASRQWTKIRNRGHHILLTEFVEWLRGNREYRLELQQVKKTISLLHDIATKIPSYRIPTETNTGCVRRDLSYS